MNVELCAFSNINTNPAESDTSKKNKVRVACVHCNKAHTCCSNSRPCERCVRLGLADSCVDIVPKKRGPKRKRSESTNVLPGEPKKRKLTKKPKKRNSKQTKPKVLPHHHKPHHTLTFTHWSPSSLDNDDLSTYDRERDKLLMNIIEQPLNAFSDHFSLNDSPQNTVTVLDHDNSFLEVPTSPGGSPPQQHHHHHHRHHPVTVDTMQTLEIALRCMEETGHNFVLDMSRMNESHSEEEEAKKQEVLHNEDLALKFSLNAGSYCGMFRKVGVFFATNLPLIDYVSPSLAEKWGFASPQDMLSCCDRSYLNLLHPSTRQAYLRSIEKMHTWKPSQRHFTSRYSKGSSLLSLTFDNNDYPIKRVGRALSHAKDGTIFEFLHECNMVRDPKTSQFKYCVAYVYWV